MRFKMKKIFLFLLIFFLTTNSYADIAIYCPHCHKHLYDYKKDEIPRPIDGKVQIYAADFIPASSDIKAPTEDSEMVCPFDQAPLNGWEYWFWAKKRSLPRMSYPAISLLTKDKDGKFIWLPDDIVIPDCLTKKCLEEFNGR